MEFAFLDTNSLIKLYIQEIGSSWLGNFIIGKQVVISELTIVESLSVVRRQHIEGKFTQIQASDLFTRIYTDRLKYIVIPVGGDVQITRLSNIVWKLSNTLRLRALDSLQLIAAESAREMANSLNPPEALTFVSSDVQLLRVAQARGFVTDNPENYP
jgi:predicted nucleic acid-binding protein